MAADESTSEALHTRATGRSAVAATAEHELPSLDDATRGALVEYLLRLGDDRLVLGHRTSEWCGHAPILEEDIALANIALDLIGQATLFLKLAGETEGKGRSEDDLAYGRTDVQYRNALLCEFPKGDFGFTVLRQFLFGAAAVHHLDGLTRSSHPALAGIAAKALKETRYHVRHCGEWVIRLGDGTDESHERMQRALDEQWRYTGELFLTDDVDAALVAAGIAPDLTALEPTWRSQVAEVLERATLVIPETSYMQRGGRQGRHTEALGPMLAEMQVLPRTFPGAQW